jgi:hypothetical protein
MGTPAMRDPIETDLIIIVDALYTTVAMDIC